MSHGGTGRRATGALLAVAGLVLLTACGTGSAQAPAATTAPQIDTATAADLGACVVDRMRGGDGIDRVQVFQAGHDEALSLLLGGAGPGGVPGAPSYVMWVTGAEPPYDGMEATSGGAQPSGSTVGVWIIEPVDRGPAVAGQPACQGEDWGSVKQSQPTPALDRLGGSVDLPKAAYDVPGPPTGPGAAPVADEVMTSLGRCVVEALVAEGSEPRQVEVYTTTWRAVSEATGAGPGDGPLDEAVYFLWATGDLEPFGGPSAVSPPSGLGALVGQWLVEPIARPAGGPPFCAGNYAGGVYEAMPVDLTMLGAPTVMPPAFYAITAVREPDPTSSS